MTDDFESQIRKILQTSPDGISAGAIAKILKVTRKEVNSHLYGGRGDRYLKVEGQPPLWTLVTSLSSPTINYSVTYPNLVPVFNQEIHVDMDGGDWKIVVQSARLSRNDHPVVIERTGANSRVITVSEMVQGVEGHAGVIALAAAALAWEIATQREIVTDENFSWGQCLRDIYLSLAVHNPASSH